MTQQEVNKIIGVPRIPLEESLSVIDKDILCDICFNIEPKGIQFHVNNKKQWVTICENCLKKVYETIQE